MDELVDQTMKSVPRGSVPAASGLEESDSDDRLIGKVIVAVEKKKSSRKGKTGQSGPWRKKPRKMFLR